MFVLGIDPGLTRCGYGAVVREGSVLRAVSAGVLTTSPTTALPERLAELQACLRALMAELGPGAVAVERVFFQVNARTAMSVGQASGLALAEAAARGCAVAQYTANEVKQAVAGYGAASKDQVQRMVQAQLGLATPPAPRRRRCPGPGPLPPRHGPPAGPGRPGRGPIVIGSLRGSLREAGLDGAVVVEVGGVGYRVLVPPVTVPALGEIGADVLLHTHLAVREDALTLYGFARREERTCFEALIGAHGVGPALALAVLSVHTPDALRRAVADDDVGSLCLVPGVGRKTAARLLIELKDRLGLAVAASAGPTGTSTPRRSTTAGRHPPGPRCARPW